MITLSYQTIITAAAVIGAVVTLFKYYNKVYDLVKHQKEQDKDIHEIKEEQSILTYGILACLKGLNKQGVDGPVTDAIQMIEKHINKKAHGQT
jgi:hypothetical protein